MGQKPPEQSTASSTPQKMGGGWAGNTFPVSSSSLDNHGGGQLSF
jgi:hypothetical protein